MCLARESTDHLQWCLGSQGWACQHGGRASHGVGYLSAAPILPKGKKGADHQYFSHIITTAGDTDPLEPLNLEGDLCWAFEDWPQYPRHQGDDTTIQQNVLLRLHEGMACCKYALVFSAYIQYIMTEQD